MIEMAICKRCAMLALALVGTVAAAEIKRIELAKCSARRPASSAPI